MYTCHFHLFSRIASILRIIIRRPAYVCVLARARRRNIFNVYTDTLSHYNSPTRPQSAAALVAVTISSAVKANSSSSSASSSSCSPCSLTSSSFSRFFIFALWITFLPYISRLLFFSIRAPHKHPLIFVTIVRLSSAHWNFYPERETNCLSSNLFVCL